MKKSDQEKIIDKLKKNEVVAWSSNYVVSNPDEQFSKILEWLYVNEKETSSDIESKKQFVEMLKDTLGISKKSNDDSDDGMPGF